MSEILNVDKLFIFTLLGQFIIIYFLIHDLSLGL